MFTNRDLLKRLSYFVVGLFLHSDKYPPCGFLNFPLRLIELSTKTTEQQINCPLLKDFERNFFW